jgi:hypothetical protein
MTGSRGAQVVLALVMGFMLAALGCSSDGDTKATPTTRRPPTSTTSTTLTTEDQVLQAYQAFWEARDAANQAPPSPEHPALREYATGDQLKNVVEETRQHRDDGLAFRLPANSISEHRALVRTINGDEATVQDCATDDGIVYRIEGGKIINDAVVTRNITATMKRQDGKWKLASTQVVQKWEGVAGCALSGDF